MVDDYFLNRRDDSTKITKEVLMVLEGSELDEILSLFYSEEETEDLLKTFDKKYRNKRPGTRPWFFSIRKEKSKNFGREVKVALIMETLKDTKTIMSIIIEQKSWFQEEISGNISLFMWHMPYLCFTILYYSLIHGYLPFIMLAFFGSNYFYNHNKLMIEIKNSVFNNSFTKNIVEGLKDLIRLGGDKEKNLDTEICKLLMKTNTFIESLKTEALVHDVKKQDVKIEREKVGPVLNINQGIHKLYHEIIILKDSYNIIVKEVNKHNEGCYNNDLFQLKKNFDVLFDIFKTSDQVEYENIEAKECTFYRRTKKIIRRNPIISSSILTLAAVIWFGIYYYNKRSRHQKALKAKSEKVKKIISKGLINYLTKLNENNVRNLRAL